MLIPSVIATELEFVKEYQLSKCNLAFGSLYQLYYIEIFDYLTHATKDPHLAFDLTQETFIKAAEKLQFLKAPGSFRFWLFKIAKNTFLSHFRKNRTWRKIDLLTNNIGAESDLESLLEKEANLDLLEKSIGTLTIDEQKLITDRYFQNKSIKALSREMGMGISAIKMKIHRIRLKLRKTLCQNENFVRAIA